MITSAVPTHLRRPLAALSALLLCTTAILFLATPALAAGSRHQVNIVKYSYLPSSLIIKAGDTVTWTNQDAVEHDVTVTSGPASFRSPMLAQGSSWSHTFTVAGPYSYVCSVHPDMRASITVSAPPPVAAPVAAPTAGSQPRERASHAPTAARTPAAAPAAAQAPVGPVATPAAQTVAAAAAAPTLQPLLLVVGASVAVIMFCLLLLASRPELVDAEASMARPRHLEEG